MPRRIVLVSGAPGAGKTTLALPLSAELRFPMLSEVHTVDTTRRTDPSGMAVQVREAFDRYTARP
ncbi:DNA/RNA helicase domain-containing protein [Streptomyces sp. WP-1]|uniref:DNA/RNA helicase domain-containing protein n=1 Tax=Streptomyces sp. WP-1 TaxID=3041497 RepID=UPI0026470270|nr:DNA/RNA helicase domain-containing protein [Streptomyces sp. WP-1]WKE70759.1 DUF2075 domain-containing protein [Streptomyces sp. WP-1]